MSWVRMTIKYAGRCAGCGREVEAGGPGLWKKGAGVRHEGCAEEEAVACAACGGPAGCGGCEFGDDCDLAAVSRPCMCAGCAGADGAYEAYGRAVGKRRPALAGG